MHNSPLVHQDVTKPLMRVLRGEREQNHAGVARHLFKDALEMLLGAHHGPEMADRLDILELGDGRLADMFQRFTSGIREEMKVETVHVMVMWTNGGIFKGQRCG